MTDFRAIAASLDERGFCVVPEFLSREEIDFPPGRIRGQLGRRRREFPKRPKRRLRKSASAHRSVRPGDHRSQGRALSNAIFPNSWSQPPLSSGSRSVFPDGVQSDPSQFLDSAGQTVVHRVGNTRDSLGSARRKVAATVQPLSALRREQAAFASWWGDLLHFRLERGPPGSRRASKSRRSWRRQRWAPATCC